MDSTLPLSATPRALPSRGNLIRAPLTLDDDSDFESSVSSKSRRNSIASDSDGFLNQEDGFETASDTPNSNNDALIHRGPNAESSPTPNGFARTFAASHGLASLLRDSDPAPMDHKFSRSPVSPMVIGRRTPKLRLPIARASMDSDDDDDDLDEDAGFSTGVNVPILRRIRSAPKATPSEFGEGDELSSGNGNVESVKEVNGNVHLWTADTIQDKAPDSSKEDEVNGEHSLTSEHEKFMHSNEEIRDIDVISDESTCVDTIDVRTIKLMESEVDELGCSSNGDQLHSNDEIREIDVINDPSTFADVADQKELNDHGIISFDASVVDLETVNLMEPNVFSSAVSADNLVHSCVDIEEVSTDHCPQFSGSSETLSEKMLVDIAKDDGNLKDACQSVFQGDLEWEVENAAKESTRLPGKEEDPTLRMDAMPKIAEIKNPNLLEAPFPYGEAEKPLTKTDKVKIEKLQQIKANYLRFLHLLGCPKNPVVSKVLHQLDIAEGRITSQAVNLDSEKREELDLSMCILVIGKSGVGKSSTVNSIFGEKKAATDAFEAGTTCLKDISVMVDGVKLKVIDTPGLKSSIKDQFINRKVLLSVKRAMQKSPPDVILYVDRLDTAINDLNDLHVLRSVASCLGSSIWQKAVVALTHASSVPLDGAHGYPISYEAFVARRSQCVQQLIRCSTGEFMMTNPVALIENNPAAGKNGLGETLLHRRESWRSQLLLLCYSMKTLTEVSSVAAKLFHMPIHSSCVHSAFTDDHSSESVDSDIRNENLPEFMPLKKSQASKLISRSLLEYDYLVKQLQTKPMGSFRDLSEVRNAARNEENWRLQTIPLPLGDMALSPSSDGGNPSFYRVLDSESTMAELACTLKGKNGFTSFGNNRTVSIAFLGEHTVFGFKIEDNVTVGERLMLVGNASIVVSQDDAACGANVELCRRDMDNPSDWDQISLGLSVTKFQDDLTRRCSLHSQFYVDNGSRLKLSASLSNKLGMQVSVKANCLEPTQVAALALLPVARAVFEKVFFPQSIKD